VVSVVLPLLFLLYFAVIDPVSLAAPFPGHHTIPAGGQAA
jgi:hypothetical protein